MKKLLFLISSLLILSQQAAFSQANSNGTGNGNAYGVGTGNGNGVGNGGRPADQIGSDGSGMGEISLITLPVTLTSFELSAQKGQVMLNWATASEKNNAYFQVERSLDGVTFSAIGQVKGNGTTHQAQQYSFKDGKPVSGTVYYRLKQVDLNGDNELSPVKAVKVVAPITQKLPVYPNPVVSDLHIELNTLPAGAFTITVNSMTNGPVKQKTVQAGELVSLNLQDIPAGAYILTITGENFKQTNKFFKN
jgi:Secretion system C-terminal sorting domain